MIVEKTIGEISTHYPTVKVDKYVVMPNHIHMILIINHVTDVHNSGRLIIAPTISTVIQQMKQRVSKQIGFSIWQKSFHDHIIRHETEYQKVWQYVNENPQKWEEDCYFCKGDY